MGLFSSNYEKAGAGVSKNAPKKKSFFKFWEIYFRKFWKLIVLNLVTFLLCLPIVTIGPALAGMTRVLRDFSQEKSTFMMHEFWKGFKNNLKQSIPIGLINVLIVVSAASSMWVYPQLATNAESNGWIFTVLCVISVSFAFTALLMNFYIMPMIISTDLSLKNIVKNSFFLTCLALKRNLLTLLFVALFSAFCYVMFFFNVMTIVVLPFLPIAFIGHIIVFNSYPVIQKYVIDPYYEERGEKNPEYRFTEPTAEDTSETVFADKGGEELPIDPKKARERTKNKTVS